MVADGKIHIVNFDGDVVILSAKDGELLTNVSMDDPQKFNVRSTITAADGNLFIRTTSKLFCIGK